MNIKSMLITTLVIVACLSPILLAHVVWRFAPVRSLDLLVVDYSVPKVDYWNHKGLFWLLNHLRILEPVHKDDWLPERDYIGFDPRGEGRSTRIVSADLSSKRWVYLADTYGVHVNDRKPAAHDTVIKGFVFGGLNDADANALKTFVERGGSIISEFNSLSDPTPETARAIMTNIMDIEWLGWSGRFVSDFGPVPKQYPWFEKLYHQNYGKTSMPAGPGMMLIHESGKMVVLHGAPFEQSMPSLALTPLGKEWMDTPVGTPPYYGWFGVIDTGNDTDVLAEIIMPTPKDWDAQFRPEGIPQKFPLLTRKKQKKTEQIYIAANVSVVDEVPTLHSLAFLPKLLSTIHRRRDSQHHGPTYWQFFVPVIGKILVDAADQEATQKK